MFRRLLSFLGLSWYVPNLPSGSSCESSIPDTEGRASVSFASGQRAGFTASEDEEGQDQRRAEITDSDLVWPGKVAEVGFPNDAEVVYRFELTVTDLEPAYYTIRPPQGGKWHPSGGVLLQPGEETRYEVIFQAPSEVKSGSRTFSIVITRFDPRRSNDPGVVVGELPTRWVAMPTAADFTLTSKTLEVVTRPWRRTALFAVELGNRSNLPPSLQMKILRAPKKEDLEKNAETVEQIGAFGQELESRRSGLFYFLVPGLMPKGSYYATVKGTARVADKIEYAIGLSKPVHVRYVPWLRMGRDWLFLSGSLFLLLYIVWGIPVYKSPQVKLTVTFDGLPSDKLLPEGAHWESVKLAITPKLYGLPGQEISVPLQQKECEFTLPGRWYGYRPFIGWHGVEEVTFRGETKLVGSDTSKAFFKEYDIDDRPLRVSSPDYSISQDGGDISVHLKKLADRLPVFGDWRVVGNDRVLSTRQIRIDLSADGLGSARKTVGVQLSVQLGGTPKIDLPVVLTLEGSHYVVHDVSLPLQEAPDDQLAITATSNPNLTAPAWYSEGKVSFEASSPYPVALHFQAPGSPVEPNSVSTHSGGPQTAGLRRSPESHNRATVPDTSETDKVSSNSVGIGNGGKGGLNAQGFKTKINPKDGAVMIFIPAGEFLMGDEDLVMKNNPPHKVMLSGYWIYKDLVTVGMYKKFCQETGKQMPPTPDQDDGNFNPNWSKEDHPIVNVSWEDAMAYCEWAGVTLPTEAQWEKAARGVDGRKYPWGNTYDQSKLWSSKVKDDDAGGTHRVGELGISPYGCTDMAGNAWQWCLDWYDAGFWSSSAAEGIDPVNTVVAQKGRVIRGGSWFNFHEFSYRTANRTWYTPTHGDSGDGFRCALTPIPP